METRSQTKQHEMEEKLSKLLDMMTTVQEQQTRQEQLSKSHQTDLEKVASAQKEQGERQEDLANRQEAKWQQLMETQDKRFREIEHKQAEAETTVQTLRDDVSSMKGVFQSRISSTEEGLEGLQTTQEKLTSELQATKSTILNELMGEVEERFATKTQLEIEVSKVHTLRAMAPEFVPSHAYSASDGTGRGSATHLQKPPPFDGRTPWDAYKLQFEMLADVNHWSDAERATYLAISLRGSALTVLTNISPDHRGEYATLVATLNKRFGSAHQADLNKAKLKGRARRRDENLPELAEDIERLTRLAYPDAPAEMIEVLSKDQFIDALIDEDLRLRLRQNKPGTLNLALEQALELESIQLANKQRTKVVREIQLESPPVNRAGFDEEALQKLQSILDAVQQTPADRAPVGKQTPSNGARGSGKIYCWYCKQEGHIQRQCTERKQDQRRSGRVAERAGAERSTNGDIQSGNEQ